MLHVNLPISDAAHKSLLRGIMREPLLHFFFIGSLLFAAFELWKPQPDRYLIVIDQPIIAMLSKTYQSQFGAAPGPVSLGALLDQYVEDEMLYREGIALALDREDEVVRRRIAQKVRFITQDRVSIAPPSDSILQGFYTEHADRYVQPETLSFSHVYFSPDQVGEIAARTAASAELTRLVKTGSTHARGRGDRFPGPTDLSAVATDDIGRLFGSGSELVRVLQAPDGDAPPGAWSGPFRSGYGWHLVYIASREPSRPRPLAEVRDQVKQDFIEGERAKRNTEGFDQIRRKYTVVGPHHG